MHFIHSRRRILKIKPSSIGNLNFEEEYDDDDDDDDDDDNKLMTVVVESSSSLTIS
jgi:hypothetical protein